MARCTRSASVPASSLSKKFDVFEFSEEDKRVQKASKKILSKFGNPKKTSSSPLNKYKFLETFARGPKTPQESFSCVPIDLDADVARDSAHEAKYSTEDISNKPLEVDDSDMHDRCTHGNSYSVQVSQQDCAVKEEISSFDGFVRSNSGIENDSLNVVSDDDDITEINSSSSSVEVGENQLLLERGSTAFDIDVIKMVVSVVPDFVMYGDIYSTQSRLIFSCSSIRLEGSAVNGNRTAFELEWTVEDIIKIESCWCGQVETVMINCLLKPNDSRESGNANQNQGVELLKFAVYDPHWSKVEEAIKSLDVSYREMWDAIFDTDTDNNENISAFGQNRFFCQMGLFPIFDQTFDEVIYPKGDPDAVSISRRDVELLQPETFINDTIIDFYIKYLKNKIPPGEQHKFHFFNSFFFRKLADLGKDPSSASDGRVAFQRVQKWTRKVNLFEKDFIFIPINYSLHWSLILICHPGEVIHFKDEEFKESSKVPCILHMDSLKGSHRGLKNLFQSYLCEEWKERHRAMVDEASKFLNLRFVSLELPQQVNFYDCGLFLLHYVELFLEEGLSNFNPFEITKFSTFLKSNWFPPEEPFLKRAHIQKLIFDIFKDNSQKAPPNDCIDKDLPSEIPGTVKHIMYADSLGQRCQPKKWHGNPSSFTCKKETDIQEADEETAFSTMENSDQVAVLSSDLPSISCFSKDFKASETSQQGVTMNIPEPGSCSRFSTSASRNALETPTEGLPLEDTKGSNFADKTDKLECSSTASEDLADLVVEDSQEADDDVDTSEKSLSFLGNPPSVPHQDSNSARCMDVEDNAEVSKKEPPESEPSEPAAKRRKFMHSGGEKRITRRMLKETCLMSR